MVGTFCIVFIFRLLPLLKLLDLADRLATIRVKAPSGAL
jgi:hypothetical protein